MKGKYQVMLVCCRSTNYDPNEGHHSFSWNEGSFDASEIKLPNHTSSLSPICTRICMLCLSKIKKGHYCTLYRHRQELNYQNFYFNVPCGMVHSNSHGGRLWTHSHAFLLSDKPLTHYKLVAFYGHHRSRFMTTKCCKAGLRQRNPHGG